MFLILDYVCNIYIYICLRLTEVNEAENVGYSDVIMRTMYNTHQDVSNK